MKKNGHSSAILAPDARGWRLRLGDGEAKSLPTLEEVMAAIPAHAHLELALPCHSVLLERHKLPATDRAELADMLQLQLEKTLPFPVDEVSHSFEVIGQDNNESTVLSVAASHAELDQICAPLREQGMLPERITLNAMRCVAACPPGENTLAIWAEQEQLVVAVASGGKLGWAQTINSIDADAVMSALPGMMMTAEIDGVPTDFQSIRLAPECDHLNAVLAEHFGKPVLPLADGGVASQELDLLPQSWQYEAKRRERTAQVKQNLLMVAVVYLVVIAGAFVYLAILKNKDRKILNEFLALQKNHSGMAAQEKRWLALAPAVVPARFGAEVMHTLTQKRGGSKDIQFTDFRYTPKEWVLKLEGTINAFFDFSKAIKTDKEFSEDQFDITYGNPTNTKDDRASFVISGKPKALPL